MPAANDREFNLQRLAANNARLAHLELKLIKTIQMNRRKLAELPEIIRRLEEQRKVVTAEMLRTGAEHDALVAEDDAVFRARADDMADDYADFLLTTQPPRPNPFGLFKEPR